MSDSSQAQPVSSVLSRDGLVAVVMKPVVQTDLLATVTHVMSGGDDRQVRGGTLHAGPHPAQAPAPTERRGADGGGGLRVLLAEDNEFNQEVLQHLLEREGHTVTIASDGRQALAKIERDVFDLLLLDCQMPEMDGFEVVAAVRRREGRSAARLPVIALTALSMPDDREHCLQAGMDDYLSKPVLAEKLREAIARVMAGKPPNVDRIGERDARLLDAEVTLSCCGGDPALLEKMIRSFRTRAATELAEMATALEQGNLKRLAELSHKLRGLVSAFSRAASAATADLEQASATGSFPTATNLLRRLEGIVHALSEQMEGLTVAELQRLGSPVLPPSL